MASSPVTPEAIDELVDTDPLRLRDVAVALLAQAHELGAERDAARKVRDDSMRVVEELRADLAAAREQREITRAEREGWRTAYERLSRQLLRRHWAWQSAKRGRARLRRELDDLAAQNAKTESNFEEFAEDIVPERDRLAEQVRVLAGIFKRTNPTALCGAHPDGAEAGCEICRDAEIFRAALGGTGGGQ